jgi:hypothetical protein
LPLFLAVAHSLIWLQMIDTALIKKACLIDSNILVETQSRTASSGNGGPGYWALAAIVRFLLLLHILTSQLHQLRRSFQIYIMINKYAFFFSSSSSSFFASQHTKEHLINSTTPQKVNAGDPSRSEVRYTYASHFKSSRSKAFSIRQVHQARNFYHGHCIGRIREHVEADHESIHK